MDQYNALEYSDERISLVSYEIEVAYIVDAIKEPERYSAETVESGGFSRADNGWKVKRRRTPHKKRREKDRPRLTNQKMFFTLSNSTHLFISVMLHVLGVTMGVFVWNLFPKNPVRYITKLPNEISFLVENIDEEAAYLQSTAKSEEERRQQKQRHFG